MFMWEANVRQVTEHLKQPLYTILIKLLKHVINCMRIPDKTRSSIHFKKLNNLQNRDTIFRHECFKSASPFHPPLRFASSGRCKDER